MDSIVYEISSPEHCTFARWCCASFILKCIISSELLILWTLTSIVVALFVNQKQTNILWKVTRAAILIISIVINMMLLLVCEGSSNVSLVFCNLFYLFLQLFRENILFY